MSSDEDSPDLITSAERRLRALCGASGYGARVDEIVALWRIGLGGRPRLPRSATPWPSDVTDDHTPFEFSLAFMPGRTELRLLTEPIVAPPSMAGQLEASQGVTRELVRHLAIDETRLRRVWDLFSDPSPHGAFVRWHAIEFSGSDRPRVKVYLNPAARGSNTARDAVETALVRLGRKRAWDALANRLVRGELDELKYFSLDLAPDREARIKVYVRHHAASDAEIEAFVAGARGFVDGRVAAFCRATLGPSPFTRRPVFSCLAWNDAEALPIATVYTPIASYVTDDAEAHDRVVGVMETVGVDSLAYERVLKAFAERRLCDGVGMQSYVSLKVDAGDPRIGVYLSPECFQIRPPRGRNGEDDVTNDTDAPKTMVAIKARIQERRLALSRVPFLQQIERSSSLEHVRQFAPHLYFYVFSFQDMLRLTADRIRDPELRQIAEQHYAEDEGHHLWFAKDAIELGFERPLTWVLGREHAPLRDLCYQLLALLLDSRDDRVRLVFPLILEAAGAEFFFRVVDLLGRAGYEGKLSYFARSHQNVEADHDVFAGATLARIDAIVFDGDTFREAMALVDRSFDLLERVAEHVEFERARAGGG